MAAAVYRPGDYVPANNATYFKGSLSKKLSIELSAVNWKFPGCGITGVPTERGDHERYKPGRQAFAIELAHLSSVFAPQVLERKSAAMIRAGAGRR